MTMVNIEYVLILTIAVDAVIDVNDAGCKCHGDELQNVILTWPVCLIKYKRPLYSLCLY